MELMQTDAVRQILNLYPKIFFACHARHVRDPKTERLLSAHQASILDHLDLREPVPLMDLARHMGVTPSTMSIAIEKLVRRRYVLRSRDSKDGRRVALLLSPAGARIRSEKSVLESWRVRGMLEKLAPPERERALHGLVLLAGAAQKFMAETAPDSHRWGTQAKSRFSNKLKEKNR